MSVIYGFLIVLEAVVSALLIGVIFLQKTKGGMGGTAFGGGMGEAIFGSRMGNVLTKATAVLGVVFLVNTVLLTMLTARREPVGSVTDLGRIEQPAPVQGPGPGAPVPVSAPIPMAPPPMEVPEAPVVVDIPVPETVAVPATPLEAPAPAPAPAPDPSE